jgi:uncharacterized protein
VDEVGVLQPKTLRSLDLLFAAHERTAGDQIVFAVFQSLDGEDLVSWTNQVFQNWKIGKKGKDNGVLLALYWKDRQMRIEVGYGLEPILTDALSKRILEEDLIPELKRGQPDAALTQSALSILKVLNSPLIKSGEAVQILQQQGVSVRKKNTGLSGLEAGVFFVLLIILFGFFFFLGPILNQGMRGRPGPWNRRRGPRPPNPWWWGGGGGGGGSGGGFSGGGGSSGGGGASGRW